MEKERYRQINQKERDRIFLLLKDGKDQKEIAGALGRDKSTISRELSRNRHKRFDIYLSDTAGRKADRRKSSGRKKCYVDKDPVLRQCILDKLKLGWSPEQIAGKTAQDLGKHYNYESIYQYLYSLAGRKKNLRKYLRRTHRIRHKRNGRRPHKGKIPNRVDIALRPRFIEKRRQFGHWEGDSMKFKRNAQTLATYTERKSRYVVAIKVRDNSASERSTVTNRCFGQLPISARKTMTFDNGLEFADHSAITNAIGTKIYFAKPYASWQRGTNENSNGLLRWYLPRDTDLNSLTTPQLYSIINLINTRPRKCLNFRTPKEIFNRELDKVFA